MSKSRFHDDQNESTHFMMGGDSVLLDEWEPSHPRSPKKGRKDMSRSARCPSRERRLQRELKRSPRGWDFAGT